jgi:hypothetical protein
MGNYSDTDRRWRGRRRVAAGTWLHDGTVPKSIEIWARPASESSSRYDDNDELDGNKPVPETTDGFLYFSIAGRREYLTVDAAKAAADAQPWGPLGWDWVQGGPKTRVTSYHKSLSHSVSALALLTSISRPCATACYLSAAIADVASVA